VATFLELANRIASDSGTASGETSISTVVGQTGRLAKIVRWTNEAWRHIQNAHKMWRWMEGRFYVDLQSGIEKYAGSVCYDAETLALTTRFGSWICTGDAGTEGRFKLYDTTIGLTDAGRLRYLPWKDFDEILRNTGASNNKPQIFTIDPQDKLAFAPIPDSNNYRVIGPYRKNAQTLSVDADTPELPSDYHDVIVSVGLHFLGTHDEAPTQIPLWELRKNRDFCRLEQDQLPQFGFAGPLA
jgi:hypothetical protein